MSGEKFKKPEKIADIDPVTVYNLTKTKEPIDLILKADKRLEQVNDKLIVSIKDNIEIRFENGLFIAKGECDLIEGIKYSPFMILSKYKFKGNHRACFEYVCVKINGLDSEYLRAGASYFKKIKAYDRFEIERTEIKPWKKEEITQDFGKQYINLIPKFDSFIIEPDNVGFKDVIGQCYNLYSKFTHVPIEGCIEWTEIIMDHIFAEQKELGYKYLKVLYEHPKKILPILVLASKKRSTGKTTFLNWLNQMFGANMVVINPDDITNSFNSSYAKANIIAIEETVSDKSSTVEKLKALSTQKFINMNQKFVDNYKVPFFGKFIITTNDEQRFMKVDEDEIRFWIRNVPDPKVKASDIEDKLIKEIPAFLYHLKNLPDIDFSKSRMVFTPEEINTNSLDIVKSESKPQLYKDLCMYFDAWFDENQNQSELNLTIKDIKNEWFYNNSQIQVSYIAKIMIDFFKLERPTHAKRLIDLKGTPKVGKYYTILRSGFSNLIIDDEPF